MAKSEKQKLKLLYIYKILAEESDAEHCISTQKLISLLDKEGINAERKSIYSDIQYLNDFGYKIEKNTSRINGGYYLKERQFELSELKLMADAVSASRFITRDRSKKLIDKIEKCACSFEAKVLKRQVYVTNRIKTQNESVFENADLIHKAIAENCRISFHYFEWTIDKKMYFRKNGELYDVSPWALNVSSENYYLIGYDDNTSSVKHYRVDKMADISIKYEKRLGKEYFEQFDLSEYTNKLFGMFGGEEQLLTIQFPNNLVGVALDRFGHDIDIRKRDDNHFSIRVNLEVSQQLYGWLAGMGPDVKILLPIEENKKYINYLLSLIKANE